MSKYQVELRSLMMKLCQKMYATIWLKRDSHYNSDDNGLFIESTMMLMVEVSEMMGDIKLYCFLNQLSIPLNNTTTKKWDLHFPEMYAQIPTMSKENYNEAYKKLLRYVNMYKTIMAVYNQKDEEHEDHEDISSSHRHYKTSECSCCPWSNVCQSISKKKLSTVPEITQKYIAIIDGMLENKSLQMQISNMTNPEDILFDSTENNLDCLLKEHKDKEVKPINESTETPSLKNNQYDIRIVMNTTSCGWLTAAKLLETYSVTQTIFLITHMTPACGNWVAHLEEMTTRQTCVACLTKTGFDPISLKSVIDHMMSKIADTDQFNSFNKMIIQDNQLSSRKCLKCKKHLSKIQAHRIYCDPCHLLPEETIKNEEESAESESEAESEEEYESDEDWTSGKYELQY